MKDKTATVIEVTPLEVVALSKGKAHHLPRIGRLGTPAIGQQFRELLDLAVYMREN